MHIDDMSDEAKKALEGYPNLLLWTQGLKRMERKLVGRDREIRSLMAAFSRPEISNVLLLGEAGSGKTAIVQGAMMRDSKRVYIEVDIAAMMADVVDVNQLGGNLQSLFTDVMKAQSEIPYEIVLFIDEFHKIIQKAPSAVEDLKPLLADSGTRGVRVVAATTYTEFREWVAPNQPLVERLQRINVGETDHDMTLQIMQGMCERYGVADKVPADILESIYMYTNRYIPANSQPRKSIIVLDAMVGWHRSEGLPFNRKLLGDVIYESEGIKIDTQVDPVSLKSQLDEVVFAQENATQAISDRLQLCLAGLNNPDAPQSTMLFTGSSGVGKTLVAKRLAELLFGDTQDSFILFDMAEYARPSSIDQFRIELTNAVWAHPFSVILLDEIEKSDPSISRLLLSVLDDGRLSDANGRVVTFNNAYIILTTNVGAEVYEMVERFDASDTGDGSVMEKYMQNIETSLRDTANTFPPELLGRIDVIVPFQPFSENTRNRIAKQRLRELVMRLKKVHGIDIDFDRRVLRYITEERTISNSNAGGARDINRTIEHDLVAPIAAFINAHPSERHISVVIDGEMAVENKTKRTSQAKIVVQSGFHSRA